MRQKEAPHREDFNWRDTGDGPWDGPDRLLQRQYDMALGAAGAAETTSLVAAAATAVIAVLWVGKAWAALPAGALSYLLMVAPYHRRLKSARAALPMQSSPNGERGATVLAERPAESDQRLLDGRMKQVCK